MSEHTVEVHDVVVVGAGPGGAHCSRLLAQRGFHVVMLEKHPFPTAPRDEKPCAGWVTPGVFEMAGETPSELGIEVQPITGAVLHVRVGESFGSYVSEFGTPVSYGVLRREFDDHLVRLAVDDGVDFRPGWRVTGASAREGSVRVEAVETGTGKREVHEGRYLVGADSAHSTVARVLGIRPRWKPAELSLAVVSETKLGAEVLRELTPHFGKPELFFTEMGYAWYFTKRNHLNVGLGVQMSRLTKERGIRAYYDELLADLRSMGQLPRTPLAPPRAYAYPVFVGPKYSTGRGRCLLVGDAGGFPQNLSGEGIRPAMLTADCAARAIARVEAGRSGSLVHAYESRWKRALGFEYLLGKVGQVVYGREELFGAWSELVREDREFRDHFFELMFARGDPKQLLLKMGLRVPLALPKILWNRLSAFLGK
ncbi:MAG: NAD(P)/FAD-dependent oxidoreductase [Promethearchaeota archaeon]